MMIEEIMEANDGAAEFQALQAELRKTKRQNRAKMNCGGPGAPAGPVIANQPNPPRANQENNSWVWKVVQATTAPDSAKKQTDAPGCWSEIRREDMEDFDVKFHKGGAITLSTPVATGAGAPRPSKMPKVVVDTQEKKTHLRS